MRVPIAVLAPLLLLGAACGRDASSDVVRQNEACAQLLGADIPQDDREGDVHFRCAVPILSVESIAGSLEHYVEVLGFSEDWTWGEPPTFASVSRGNVGLFFCERCQGNPGTWISVFVDDVDRLHEQYSDTGAIVLRPPQDEAWGTREMIVRDPDGHVLRFSAPIEK
jgi:uncharacterized glyoxalase superfamily protein PhnB